MGLGLGRTELRRLAEAKLADAMVLFEHDRFGNAYYLAGYAVELALKACAARQFTADAIPDKALVQRLHSHRLLDLAGAAGLAMALKRHQDADSRFAANWGIVIAWMPESRYEPTGRSAAQFLLEAIDEHEHGVLPWIRTFW